MSNEGILFIPDISGFTHFVTTTEVNHSKHIISELLEVLIEANELKLDISEIEGDAILFYKYGPAPSAAAIYSQVKQMFIRFHQHLSAYDQFRICDCGACTSASSLDLKVITHQGSFTTYRVKQFEKLMGESLITAHRLLKNEGLGHSYWLITDGLVPQTQLEALPLNWQPETRVIDNSKVHFQYADLSKLKDEIQIEKQKGTLSKRRGIPALTVTDIITGDLHTVARFVTDISLRPQWLAGVVETREIKYPINQIGNEHSCVLNDRCDLVTTRGFERTDTTITYRESVGDMGEMVYALKLNAPARTEVSISFYLEANAMMRLLFKMIKRKQMVAVFKQSILRLELLTTGDIHQMDKDSKEISKMRFI